MKAYSHIRCLVRSIWCSVLDAWDAAMSAMGKIVHSKAFLALIYVVSLVLLWFAQQAESLQECQRYFSLVILVLAIGSVITHRRLRHDTESSDEADASQSEAPPIVQFPIPAVRKYVLNITGLGDLVVSTDAASSWAEKLYLIDGRWRGVLSRNGDAREILYRSDNGRYFLEHIPLGRPTYLFADWKTSQEAAAWLVANGDALPDDLASLADTVKG